MPNVRFSDVIDSGADDVWTVLKKFGELAKWHPAIAASSILDGSPDSTPGIVRKLTLQDGATMTERLLSIDDGNRALSYKFEEAPLPLDNYVLKVSVTPLTGQKKSFIDWEASFDLRESDPSKQYESLMAELIASGSKALGEHLLNAAKR